MPAFKKFGPGDQLDNVLILQPQYDLTSGSNGWRGSPEGSASLSLYGGARRIPGGVFGSITYESHAPNINQTGHPSRGLPMTASVHYVYMTDEELNLAERTSERWGREHFKVVQRLYQDYYARDPDYITASYDHYCLYFQKDSRNVVSCLAFGAGGNAHQPTGSFTFESWIKPFLTQSADQDFTIQSIKKSFWFGITGSNGLLALSSSAGIFTSSFGPEERRWHHVAVRFDSTSQTGTFYIDLTHAGDFTMSGIPFNVGISSPVWSIGNIVTGSSDSGNAITDSGSLKRSFHGFVSDARFWASARTWSEISGAHNRRLSGSELGGPLAYLPLSDGPQKIVQWPSIYGIGTIVGSGALNLSPKGLDYNMAKLNGFSDRAGPVWHPSDNHRFFLNKSLVEMTTSASFGGVETVPVKRGADITKMRVIDIPSAFYGRQITPGSVRLECRAYSSGSHGLVRVLIDDARGGLFISGSACSSSIASREEYRGVEWNKVGNVFYGEGLIVIREPTLLDFGRHDSITSHPADSLQLSFMGDSRVPVKTLMCRVDRGEFNATLNQTFRDTEDDGIWERRFTSGTVRVTTVGLYNSDRELVGVARLADPVRIRSRDRISFRIRMDF